MKWYLDFGHGGKDSGAMSITNKLVFPNVFQHAFLNGLRPPAYVEEHLQYLVFIHGTQNFFGKG